MCRSTRIVNLIKTDVNSAYKYLIKTERDAEILNEKVNNKFIENGGPWTFDKNNRFLKEALFSLALIKGSY